MSLDHVFWMSVWERLGLMKWFPDSYPHVYPQPALPRKPGFPSDAKDYAGALLFDSNAWVEEQQFCSPLPFAQSSDHEISSTEPFLLKSCLPLPVQEVMFRPTCPVLQHQPRVEISIIKPLIPQALLEQAILNQSMDFIPQNPLDRSMLGRSIYFIHTKPVAFVSMLEMFFLMVLIFLVYTTRAKSLEPLDSIAQSLGPFQT